MSDNYWKESRIHFSNIFDTINDVYKISNSITRYIENLDKMYKNLLNYKTNDKNLLYFGLNTFYFQIRFLQSQYEDSKRQFVFLLNHFYADYYKLYKLIKYHVESGSDEKLKIKIDLELTFPIYDDLSPYTQYKESDIVALHEYIINILETIDNENVEFAKTNSINELQNNHQNGIPIANFIHGLSHEQSIMEEYINLYKHYLEFFKNFYNDECMTYKHKLETLFENIKDHAPLDNNPLLKKICKTDNCSHGIYLNTVFCELHYKLNKKSTNDNINIKERVTIELNETKPEATDELNETKSEATGELNETKSEATIELKVKDITNAIELKEKEASIELKEKTASIELKEKTAAIELKEKTAAIELKEKEAAIELKEKEAAIELKEKEAAIELKEKTAKDKAAKDKAAKKK